MPSIGQFKICSPSPAMVTSPYEWKILEWEDKLKKTQTKYFLPFVCFMKFSTCAIISVTSRSCYDSICISFSKLNSSHSVISLHFNLLMKIDFFMSILYIYIYIYIYIYLFVYSCICFFLHNWRIWLLFLIVFGTCTRMFLCC